MAEQQKRKEIGSFFDHNDTGRYAYGGTMFQ
jgi:hypothetical protein